jgi:hypothetical protein
MELTKADLRHVIHVLTKAPLMDVLNAVAAAMPDQVERVRDMASWLRIPRNDPRSPHVPEGQIEAVDLHLERLRDLEAALTDSGVGPAVLFALHRRRGVYLKTDMGLVYIPQNRVYKVPHPDGADFDEVNCYLWQKKLRTEWVPWSELSGPSCHELSRAEACDEDQDFIVALDGEGVV